MKDSLYDVVNAIRIARSSFRRIKINFIWAFLYNVLLIPIAMGVLYPSFGFKLDPMLAGGSMALSSISVVLSSLMLKLFKPSYKLETDRSFDKQDGKSKKYTKMLNEGAESFADEKQHKGGRSKAGISTSNTSFEEIKEKKFDEDY